MSEPFPEELLSAYLDDELSPEERQRVDEHLAASAEARRLVEELRALGKALRDMSRFELDDQFRTRVLYRAERTMLQQPADSPAASAPLAERTWPLRRALRPLIYASAAVAAALMIMFVNREPNAPVGPVARRTRPTASAPEIPAAGEVMMRKAAEPAASGARDAERLGVPADEDSYSNEQREMGQQEAASAPDEVTPIMLVEVDVSRQAAEEGAFDTLLAQQNITLEVYSDASDVPAPVQEKKAEESDLAILRSVEPESGFAYQEERKEGRVYYVQATASQLAGTLAQLQVQTQQFPAVRVAPDPHEPSQTALERFNRGLVRERGSYAADASLPQVAGSDATPSLGNSAKAVEERELSEPGRADKEGVSATSDRLERGSDKKPASKDDKVQELANKGDKNLLRQRISRAKLLSKADAQAVVSNLDRHAGDRAAQNQSMVQQLKQLKSWHDNVADGREQKLHENLNGKAISKRGSHVPSFDTPVEDKPMDVLFLVNVVDAEAAPAKPDPPPDRP